TGVTTVAGQGPANTDRATRPTSRFVEKRSFLELQAITASYDVRGAWIERSPIGNLRLNFSIEDLFHASTVKTERGITYPYSRNFSLGVQLTF
ncbi:MAG: hypothetical protein LUD68_00700, partial [Rikenellaceae bacterium]|nr:hypothetical protein [Rikenellaceae bacterium]